MKLAAYTGIFLSALIWISCSGKKDENQAIRAVPVKVVKVSELSYINSRNYVGTVEAVSSSSLSFEVMGNVSKVFVTEGENVQKGKLLATLDKATLQNSYNASLASLKEAQDAYNRMKSLYDNGSLPEMKWVEVQSKLQQAVSMEQISRKSLKDAGLYAPFSGVISSKSIEAGMNVMPGIEVMQLADISTVNIKIAVPEKEISRVNKGQQAEVMVGALGDKLFTGVVSEKGIAANPLAHTYEVKIKLNNTSHELMPGMVCKVGVHSHEAEAGIVLPNHTVQLQPDGKKFVWVVKGNAASQRMVSTGELTTQGVVITAGLQPGDEVIVSGNQKVSEGTKIAIK
ncbi:efflux RND transporter periplasmic adaptor subunit [Bacteroides graminisolvens]|uniref:efflux RND transporter periplasmic adaptor subunit n=1 Tax=Bacteroides graminisolvens TaxID=477666 RepID=UPI0029C96E1D|nr:efflux RND transporter periplasmic adaptor subunit [Bacteroides graminisolvens]